MNDISERNGLTAKGVWYPRPQFSGTKQKCWNEGTENFSDLSHLDVSAYDYDPIVLFKSWYDEAKRSGLLEPHAACLATSTRDGQVMARHLLLRRLDPDNGFVIMTDRRSAKSKHLTENPIASMSFLWCYKRDDDKEVNRQVRVDGQVTVLERSEFEDLYDSQPIFCKVRAHLCHQGGIIDDWNTLKSEHDSLYNDAKQGKQLTMPDHFIGYKLHPKVIEFYDTIEFQIADRALFRLKEDGSWQYDRLAA